MRKKSGFTIVEQAIVLVPEFEKVVRKLEQQVTLRGQSKVLYKITSGALRCLWSISGSCPSRLTPKRLMNTWLHWPATPVAFAQQF
jgi:hypothetical protein